MEKSEEVIVLWQINHWRDAKSSQSMSAVKRIPAANLEQA